MRVTGYTHWWDSRYEDIDVVAKDEKTWEKVDEAVKESLRENKIRFSPDYHQHGIYGVPVIDDKYRVTYSLRSFARILSEVYGGTYLDYYCQEIDDPVVPQGDLRMDLADIESIQKLKEEVCVKMSQYKRGWLPVAQKTVNRARTILRKCLLVLSLKGVNRSLKDNIGLTNLINAKISYDAAKQNLAKRIEAYKGLRQQLKFHQEHINFLDKGGEYDNE